MVYFCCNASKRRELREQKSQEASEEHSNASGQGYSYGGRGGVGKPTNVNVTTSEASKHNLSNDKLLE